MIYLFYFFALALIWFSLRAFRGGLAFRRYIHEECSRKLRGELPPATIFAPCRGVDLGFEQNLKRLFDQKGCSFEVVFIVDDENDEAVPLIKKAIGEFSSEHVRSRLLIAPPAVDSSQKIANLLFAVREASESSEVFVFVDSDARMDADWLASLVAGSLEPGTGAATGYRWIFSMKNGLGAELSSVWNASVASALGPNTSTNFCWGGSMAIRRDTFYEIDVESRWRGALSDDLSLGRAAHDAGLGVKFVPQAMCATYEKQTLAEMLEFTTRQMKITRVYSPRLWLFSMFGSILFCGTMIASVLLLAFSPFASFQFAAALFTLFCVSFLTIGKALIRLRALADVFVDLREELRGQTASQCLLAFVTPAIFFVNTIAALFSRRIAWRGTKYELKSPHETVIIREKR